MALATCDAFVFFNNMTLGQREQLCTTTSRWFPPGISNRSTATHRTLGNVVDLMGSILLLGPTSCGAQTRFHTSRGMQVSSIEGCFDRQKSIRSKTRVSSIKDCNYCLSVLNLLFIKSVEKFFLIQLTSELCRSHS